MQWASGYQNVFVAIMNLQSVSPYFLLRCMYTHLNCLYSVILCMCQLSKDTTWFPLENINLAMVTATNNRLAIVGKGDAFWICPDRFLCNKRPYELSTVQSINIESIGNVINQSHRFGALGSQRHCHCRFVSQKRSRRQWTHILDPSWWVDTHCPSFPPYRCLDQQVNPLLFVMSATLTYNPPSKIPKMYRSWLRSLLNLRTFGTISFLSLNALEWIDSSFCVLESNVHTWTHLSRVPVAMRVVLPVVVSAVRLNISPPHPILTEWMASNRPFGTIYRINLKGKMFKSYLGWTMLQEYKISQCITVTQCVECLVFVCYP